MALHKVTALRTLFLLAPCVLTSPLSAATVFSSDYETYPGDLTPYLSTWSTEEAHSGTHSIKLPAADPNIVWYQNPRFYVANLPSSGDSVLKFTYWTKAGPASTQAGVMIPYSPDWTQRVDFIRTIAGDNFGLWSNGTVYMDDMKVETSNSVEFAAVKHANVADLGVAIHLNQASATQNRLPNTFNALQTGRPLRVVMLGDSIVADTWTSAWDLYVENHYPGAQIQLTVSTRGGGGMDWYAQTETDGVPRIKSWVLDYQPDLVILGGISTHSSEDFRGVIDQIKAGSNAEILLTTGAAGDNPHHAGDARLLSDWAFELGTATTTGSDSNTVAYREELAGHGGRKRRGVPGHAGELGRCHLAASRHGAIWHFAARFHPHERPGPGGCRSDPGSVFLRTGTGFADFSGGRLGAVVAPPPPVRGRPAAPAPPAVRHGLSRTDAVTSPTFIHSDEALHGLENAAGTSIIKQTRHPLTGGFSMHVLLALFNHPHPLLRALVFLILLGTFFCLLGAAIYARHRRHVELASRLKSLEEKIDRLTSPPSPPVSKAG